MDTAQGTESVRKAAYQLDLDLPTLLIQKCLSAAVGEDLEFTAYSHISADSEVTIKLKKWMFNRITLSFTGIKQPVLKVVESHWHCNIGSILDADSPEDKTGGGQPETTEEEEAASNIGKRKKKIKTEDDSIAADKSQLRKGKQGKRGISRGRKKIKKGDVHAETTGSPSKYNDHGDTEPDEESPLLDNVMDDNDEPFVNEEKLDVTDDDIKVVPPSKEGYHTTCQLCGLEFNRKISLRAHVRNHNLTYAEYADLVEKRQLEDPGHSEDYQPVADHVVECQICGRQARNQPSLSNHIRVHKITIQQYNQMLAEGTLEEYIKSGDLPQPKSSQKETLQQQDSVKCQICSRKFPTMNSLQNHIRSHNMGWYKYQELLDEGTLEQFLEEDSEVIIDPEQRRQMKKADDKNRPGRPNTESQQNNTIFCMICSKSYKSLGSLRAHIRKKHPGEESKKETLENIEEYRRKTSAHISPIVIECPVCDIRFHGSRILKHMKDLHHQIPNFEDLFINCRRTFSKMRQEQDSKVEAWTTYKTCRLCGKRMRQRFMQVHLKFRCTKNPQRVKSLRCNRCSYITTKQEDLEAHIKKHDPGRTYMCHLCGKSYKNNSGLVIHERTVHEIVKKVPPKQFNCQHCHRTFIYKNRYEMHMVKHTDKATVQCDICGKLFKTDQDVKRHKKTQHMGIYRYHCEKCGHGMEKMSYMKSHKCGRVRRKEGEDPEAKDDKLHSVNPEELAMAEAQQYEVLETWTTTDDVQYQHSLAVVDSQSDEHAPNVKTQRILHPGPIYTTVLPNSDTVNWGQVVSRGSQQRLVSSAIAVDPSMHYIQLEPTIYASDPGETLVSLQTSELVRTIPTQATAHMVAPPEQEPSQN